MGVYKWDLLLRLTKDIPDGLDRSKSGEPIPQHVQDFIKQRDKECQLCGSTRDLVIHHIIPNGPASPDNLILLCRRCHYIVHMLLWISGKWKYPARYKI